MPDPTHIDPELLAGLADHYSITQEEATERLVRGVTGHADPVRVSGPPIPARAQHMADMAAITEQVADEGGPLGTPTAFAVLRDIADAEPLYTPGSGSTIVCIYCGADDRAAYPVEHLISCPWVRATQIVGVKDGA